MVTTARLDRIARVLLICAIGIPLIVFPWVQFPFVFGKVLFFQTLVVAAGALVVSRGALPLLRDPLTAAIGLFFAISVLSAVLGVDQRRSFLGSEERSAGVLFLAHTVLFYYLVRVLFRDNRDWQTLGRAATIFSGILAIVAIIQVIVFNRAGVRFWGIDAGGRAAGLLSNPIFLGVFLPLAVPWMMLGIRRERGHWRWVSWAALGAAVVSLYFTRSRGAHGAALVAIATGSFFYCFTSPRRSLRRGIVTALLFGLIASAGLFAFRSHSIVAGLPVVGPILSSSWQNGTLGTRAMAWRAGIRAFLDRPILGWGPDAFHLAFNRYYDPRFLEFSYYETWFDRAHNVLVDIMVMMGAAGILALAAAIVVVVASIRRGLMRGRLDRYSTSVFVGGLVGYAVASLAAFDNPSSSVYFMVILAYLSWCAWGIEISNLKSQISNPKHFTFRMVVSGLTAGILIIVLNVIPALVSAKNRKMSSRFIVGQDAEGVRIFSELLDAWTIYPEEPRVDGAITLTESMIDPSYTEDRLKTEFPILERATNDLVRFHPQQAYYWYLRGRVFSEASRFDSRYREEAERSFERAAELSPNRQQIAYGLGKLYLLHGENDKAVSVMQGMVDLDPKVAQSHWYFGLALLDAGFEEHGEEELVIAEQLGYDPQNVNEALLLRELFLRRGEAAVVAEYAIKVAELDPTASRFAELARAQAAAGNDADAEKSVRRAVELDPSFADEAEIFLTLMRSGALRASSSSGSP